MQRHAIYVFHATGSGEKCKKKDFLNFSNHSTDSFRIVFSDPMPTLKINAQDG